MPGLHISRLTTLALLLAALGATSCSRKLSDPMAPRAIDRGLSTLDTESATGDDVVVMMVQPGVDPLELLAGSGAEIIQCESAQGLVSLRPAPTATLAQLEQTLTHDDRVLALEPERVFENAETRQRSFAFDDGLGSHQTYEEQPAASVVGLQHAHQVTRGAGVLVAILDTGVDLSHEAIAEAIAGGRDFVEGDVNPSEARNGIDDDGDGDVDEAYGHGTHVAGIVRLAAPDARLLIARVLDSDGRGSLLRVAAGVRWAVQRGARVINLSLGSLGHSVALDRALAEAEAAGVVVVASAGNWGGFEPVEFPASSSHVMAVAAVDASRAPAEFTSRGSFVALSAPGVGVRSTYPGDAYLVWSGTSMAAPFVAGTAALLRATDPGLSVADLRQRLQLTAVWIPGAPGNGMGSGCLDAASAVAPALVIDPEEPEDFRLR